MALLGGAALTNLRTPAVSAVATDALARGDSRSLGINGSGPQCVGHAAAMLCVRPEIDSIVIGQPNARERRRGGRFRDRGPGGDRSQRVTVGSYAEAAACDIICRATRSTEPARDEAGDLIRAAAEGWSWDRVAGDLADVCCCHAMRRSAVEVTLFKRLGLAAEDLVITRLAAHETNLL